VAALKALPLPDMRKLGISSKASRRDLAQFTLVKRTPATEELKIRRRDKDTEIAVDDSAFLIGRALLVAGWSSDDGILCLLRGGGGAGLSFLLCF